MRSFYSLGLKQSRTTPISGFQHLFADRNSALAVHGAAISCSATTKRPNRKDIAVGGVSDSARSIEDTGHAFLGPVTTWQLSLDQIVYAAFDGYHVVELGRGQCQECPGCVDNAATVITVRFHSVGCIVFIVAGCKVFTPTTVGPLMLQ
jgi:hypothetical protein